MQLTALGQRIVVINTLKSAVDLLDRKALATSRRPRNIVVGIMTNNLMFAFIDPGKNVTFPSYPLSVFLTNRPECRHQTLTTPQQMETHASRLTRWSPLRSHIPPP